MTMNPMKHAVCLSLAAVGLFSCGGENRGETPQEQVLRLESAVVQKDSLLDEVFGSLNRIAGNLTEIKDREGIVTSGLSSEISREQGVRILEDISAIDSLLARNRRALSRLNATAEQLRRADIRSRELERLIATYTEQIESKDRDIERLRAELAESQLLVGTLRAEADSLRTDIAGQIDRTRTLEQTVAAQDEELNTVYYIIGSQRELTEAGVIEKSGFIGRTLTVGEGFDPQGLTAVDRRELDRVIVGARRAEIVSAHPTGSYQLITDNNDRLEEIRITDPERFWGGSRVLVVAYR